MLRCGTMIVDGRTVRAIPCNMVSEHPLEITINKLTEAVGWETAKVTPYLSVGIKECDAYLADRYRCIQEKTPKDDAPRRLEDLAQTADHWRRAAATPEGRQSLARSCLAMKDSNTRDGCR